MTIEAGTRLGPYEIFAPIGAGGMGEVYRARDTRLDRTVAIKVLPEHLAESPERKARFEREAKAISKLNHPHICTLYDVGEQDGVDFIVMEYIEGETLAERLKKGALPLDKALEYGIQIAAGLDTAHRAGIVHRDLKPPNVMLTKSGIKLLDFGLARLVEGDVGPETSDAPTRQKDLTKEESIIGTLQYMAPEQLEAKAVDARTDIWAFGAVLYEMVTGRKAFQGESQASLITAIMSASPAPVSSSQRVTPRGLDRIVNTCLAKDPDERWGTAGDVGKQLSWVMEPDEAMPIAAPRGRGRWIVVLVAAIVSAAAAFWLGNRPAPEPRITRLVVDLPPDHRIVIGGFHPVALSPDGNTLVYAATSTGDDASQLFVHRLDRFNSEPIPDTTGASEPFFAPDGVRVGFLVRDALHRVSLESGAIASITDGVQAFRGASWGPDDFIVFSDLRRGIMRVAVDGGEVRRLTTPDERGLHRFPRLLPDGRYVLFSVGTGNESLAVLSVDSGEWDMLGTDGAGATYVATGHIAYGLGGTVHLKPFDIGRLTTTGDSVPLLRDVYTAPAFNQAFFSACREGSVAYVTGVAQSELVWVDREGEASGLELGLGFPFLPRLSPDGRQLAVAAAPVGEGAQQWIVDLDRGTRTRLLDEGLSFGAIWSPDGSRVYFLSNASGRWLPVSKSSDGSGSVEALDIPGAPTSWSPDGSLTVQGDRGWVLPPEGKARLLWPDNEIQGLAFSPDGKWVTYVSDLSGRSEVYARAYPEGDRTVTISNDGGVEPQWSRDGRELFYVDDDQMMVVPVSLSPSLEVGTPRALFSGGFILDSTTALGMPNYDVALDGNRFLMVRTNPSTMPRRIHVVRNWTEELKELTSDND